MARDTSQRDTTRGNQSKKEQGSRPQPVGTQSASTERERDIDTQREGTRDSGLTRRPLTSPVYGGGTFPLMRRMFEDMDRLFNSFGFGRTPLALSPFATRLDTGAWYPQVETFRRGDKIVVRADLPGLKKEDVKVQIDNDVLSISGERSEEHEEDREDIYRSERSYGQFYRAIPLPEGANLDQTEATFKDGVLEVTLPVPKQEVRRAKEVQIR